jgi:hypothetical protein
MTTRPAEGLAITTDRAAFNVHDARHAGSQ